MLDVLNKKICNPNQKLKCNTIANNPKMYKSPLFTFVTVLMRYVFTFVLGAVFINPIVGLVSIFYPFAQIIPFYHVYTEYLIEITTLDFIIFYGGLLAMIGYYYYVFNQLGSYVFIQLGSSLLLSVIMILIGNNLYWGLISLLVNIIVTISIDIILVKKSTRLYKKV